MASTAMGCAAAIWVTLVGYSTSTAWRLWYQPQLPHTTCGSFAAAHRGQTLRGGAFSVQALARRLRLFAFEVFFLGTAIADSWVR
jgi:hypothetical protein